MSGGYCGIFIANITTQSDVYATYSLSFGIFMHIYIAISVVLLILRRHSERLASRTLWLLLMFSVGMVIGMWVAPIARYIVGPFPCELYNMLLQMSLVTVLWPLLARLFIWKKKIDLNILLAEHVSKFGSYKENPSKELIRGLFYTSWKFEVLVTLVPYFTVAGASLIFIYASDVCAAETCGGLINLASLNVYVVIACIFLIILPTGIFYRYRDVPDSIGIRKETLYGFIFGGGLVILGALLSSLDVAGYGSESQQDFSWTAISDFGEFVAFTIVIPLQIYLSFQKREVKKQYFHDLKDLLKNRRGFDYFQLYLATELSLENLLFYRAGTRWKSDYQGKDQGDRKLESAQRLYDLFFLAGPLELNLSYEIKNSTANTFTAASTSGDIPDDVFDEALNEVYILMSQQSYPRFLTSDFYKLYTGEIKPTEVGYMRAPSLSTYSNLDARLSFNDDFFLERIGEDA